MIEIRTIVEIAGFPEKHVQDTMQKVIEKIKEDKEIKILKVEVAPTQQVKKVFSTFAELDLNFNNMKNIFDFCFNFMPSSIEILNEEPLKEESKNIEDIMNDLLAKLHQYEMVIRSLDAYNIKMKKQIESTSQKREK